MEHREQRSRINHFSSDKVSEHFSDDLFNDYDVLAKLSNDYDFLDNFSNDNDTFDKYPNY